MAEVKDRDEQLETARLYHPSLPIITRMHISFGG